MFAVGGAGAQKEIGIKIIKSLVEKIKKREIKIILSAGIREKVKEYFEKNIKKLGLGIYLGYNIEIIFEKDILSYFQKFNESLRKTDILWTKPSEISFYTALGLPIIIAPPIGSQEEFNKKWLLRLGSGIPQENPSYTHQWLFDFLESGRFAEAAMQGFIEGEKLGTLNIEKIISEI
jgi:UDP-N-acetylglucosamine:LPS N-acetylglucosamine transferase